MKKTTTIHPFHCEFAGTSDGFTLTFFDRTEGGNELRYILHFEFWWVRHIADMLWKAIGYHRTKVSAAEVAMTKEPS